MYLRATVTYTDVHGDQEVSGVTTRVEPRTLANAAPSFDDLDEDENAANGIQVTRSVNENAKGDIGEPVTATDGDNDVLLYSLVNTPDRDDEDDARFTIDEDSGQISAAAGLNFETPADELNTAADNDVDNAAGNNEYVIRVRATDPSSAYKDQDVLITVKDVNESPAFDTDAAPLKDQLTLYIDENRTSETTLELALRIGEAATAVAPGAYTAADNDGDADTIGYTVEGADKKYFSIGGTDGALGFTAELSGEGKGANFEKKSSYSITIVATSTDADPNTDPDRGSTYGRLNLTIKVVDGEDTGKVNLSAREPQVGRSVNATASDEDGGMSGVSWQWYRSALVDTDVDEDTDADNCALPGAETWQIVSSAKSPVYTADSATFDHDTNDGTDPVEYCLQATVTYTDNIDSDQSTDAGIQLEEEAHGVSEAPVQISNPANTAPKFEDDQDFNTPGDQADAMRSVVENDDDATVGDAVAAGDDDLLMYSLSGDYASSFDVDNNGQIKTTVELDFETKSSYMVMLTATDPSGAYDMINVMITVMDGPDDAMITGVAEYDYAEDRMDEVATFSASDPDADAGDIEWTLSGPDADIFKLSDAGRAHLRRAARLRGREGRRRE